MARYRKVSVRIWGDRKFRELSQNAQLLFFYLLTGPETTNIPGIVLTCPEIAGSRIWGFDTVSGTHSIRFPDGPLEVVERSEKAFAELEKIGLIKTDRSAKIVWLPNAIRHNQPDGPCQVLGWKKVWPELPDSDLIPYIIEEFTDHFHGRGKALREAWAKVLKSDDRGFDTVSGTVPNTPRGPTLEGPRDQEQEQDQDYIDPTQTLPPSGRAFSEPIARIPEPTPERTEAADRAWALHRRHHPELPETMPKTYASRTGKPRIAREWFRFCSRLDDGWTAEQLCRAVELVRDKSFATIMTSSTSIELALGQHETKPSWSPPDRTRTPEQRREDERREKELMRRSNGTSR